MKPIILFLILLTIFSCSPDKKEIENEEFIETWIEQSSPFTELFFFKIKDNKWIRNPENILTAHETFKHGFYQTYLTNEVLDQKPFVNGDVYYNLSLRTKIDSLVKTYNNYNSSSKYYKEFWNRRIQENNDSVVYLVLSEIQQLINGEAIDVRDEYVSKKLKTMIDISIDWQNGIDNNKAMSHFEFLLNEKMHQSAYNLLYENSFYNDLRLNKDSLVKMLIIEKNLPNTNKNRAIFIIDNSK